MSTYIFFSYLFICHFLESCAVTLTHMCARLCQTWSFRNEVLRVTVIGLTVPPGICKFVFVISVYFVLCVFV